MIKHLLLKNLKIFVLVTLVYFLSLILFYFIYDKGRIDVLSILVLGSIYYVLCSPLYFIFLIILNLKVVKRKTDGIIYTGGFLLTTFLVYLINREGFSGDYFMVLVFANLCSATMIYLSIKLLR